MVRSHVCRHHRRIRWMWALPLLVLLRAVPTILQRTKRKKMCCLPQQLLVVVRIHFVLMGTPTSVQVAIDSCDIPLVAMLSCYLVVKGVFCLHVRGGFRMRNNSRHEIRSHRWRMQRCRGATSRRVEQTVADINCSDRVCNAVRGCWLA